MPSHVGYRSYLNIGSISHRMSQDLGNQDAVGMDTSSAFLRSMGVLELASPASSTAHLKGGRLEITNLVDGVELLQFRIYSDVVALGDGDVLVEGQEAELPVVVRIPETVCLMSKIVSTSRSFFSFNRQLSDFSGCWTKHLTTLINNENSSNCANRQFKVELFFLK